MTPDEYLAERLDDQIGWFDRKSQESQRWYKRLRAVEIVAASLIPLLAGWAGGSGMVAVTMGLLGVVVAVVAAVLTLFQFERNWLEYRAACERLRRERILYRTGAAPFDRGQEAAFRLLVERVESILAQENQGWVEKMQAAGDRLDQVRE